MIIVCPCTIGHSIEHNGQNSIINLFFTKCNMHIVIFLNLGNRKYKPIIPMKYNYFIRGTMGYGMIEVD